MENNILIKQTSNLQESFFYCFCGQKIRITPEEDLNRHIKNCKNYMTESPIAKVFLNLNLGKLNLPQLIALKLEYLYFVDLLASEMDKSIFFLIFRTRKDKIKKTQPL